MRIAYLVNCYPKVSHTFIRREILALEAGGLDITRVSVRRTDDELVDPADVEEAKRTRVILDGGVAGLLIASLRVALTRPASFLRALACAARLGRFSERGRLRNFAYLAEACVLVGWLKDAGVAHVHAHFGTNSTAVVMLCHLLGGPGYSFTVHGPEEFDKPLMISLREKIERARFVAAISSFARSQLYRHCGHEHWKKIHVVHCGLDRELLSAPMTPIPEHPRLVSVGRLNEQKGQLLLVEVIARVIESGQQLELVLVGDGEMRAEIEQLMHARGISQHVRITGWASNARVREEIEAARCLVLPSFAEGLPVVIMEALALGRPVLTTAIAGIPELVDAECGWLVPAGSRESLTQALHAVLSTDRVTLERMGQEGRTRVAVAHDARLEADRLRELFGRYAD